MGRRLRIALAIESSRCFGRDLLTGIAAYAHTFGPWSFFRQERSIDAPLPSALKRWKPDGLLVRIVDGRIGQRVQRLGVPTVDLLDVKSYPEIPRLLSNAGAIARMAVDHLLDRGFRQFGYVGFHGVRFSDERRLAMCQYLAAKGHSTSVFEEHGSRHAIGVCEVESGSPRQTARLAAWLDALPKPIGLVACNDVRAQQVINVCGERGIPVPDAVALVGVDNDALLCQLCDPPLSSVDPSAQKIGYEGAALLHRMIEGEHLPAHDVVIDPAGVVSRQSTDALAIADPVLVEAVRYLREHACEGLMADDLRQRLHVSRRTLERWFAKDLGRSPAEEIARVKLERVKELLAGTHLTLDKIAHLAGYEYEETMYRAFREACGQTPGEFRNSRHLRSTEFIPSAAESTRG